MDDLEKQVLSEEARAALNGFDALYGETLSSFGARTRVGYVRNGLGIVVLFPQSQSSKIIEQIKAQMGEFYNGVLVHYRWG